MQHVVDLYTYWVLLGQSELRQVPDKRLSDFARVRSRFSPFYLVGSFFVGMVTKQLIVTGFPVRSQSESDLW
jgi:hypothetical protein